MDDRIKYQVVIADQDALFSAVLQKMIEEIVAQFSALELIIHEIRSEEDLLFTDVRQVDVLFFSSFFLFSGGEKLLPPSFGSIARKTVYLISNEDTYKIKYIIILLRDRPDIHIDEYLIKSNYSARFSYFLLKNIVLNDIRHRAGVLAKNT
jgi:hypothetical protein